MKKVALVSFVLLSFVSVVRGMSSSQKSQCKDYREGWTRLVTAVDKREGTTQLMLAADAGDPDTVCKLLEKDNVGDLKARNTFGQTALVIAKEARDNWEIRTKMGYGRGSEGFSARRLGEYQAVVRLLEDAERKAKK